VAVALVAAVFIILGCDDLITETTNITQVDTTLGLECSRCHTDGNNRYLRPQEQWRNSAHASDDLLNGKVNLNGDLLSVATCGPECHTHEGYLYWMENGTRQTQSAPNVIGCFTCHSPHTGDFGTWSDTILRDVNSDNEDYVNLVTGIYDIGRSNLCAQCHQATEAHPRADTNKITIDSDFGPHFSCQADVIIGEGGYLFGYAAPSNTHKSNKNGCLSCHFGTGQAYQFGEHTFELEDKTTGAQYLTNCNVSGCHSSNALTNLYEFSDYDSIPILADSLESLLRIWGYLDPDDEEGVEFTTNVTVSSTVANIINNYLLFKMDGSNGVHNPAYFEKLLSVSVEKWNSIPPAVNFGASQTEICVGDTVWFSDSSVSLTTVVRWEWDFGDGGSSSDQNPFHVYIESGAFDVTLTATDNYGSTSKQKDGYIAADGVTAVFDTDTTEGFADLTITFTDASSCVVGEDARWYWDFGDGDTTSFSVDSAGDPVVHTYTSVGTYSPTLTIKTAIDTSSYETTITAIGPIADFEASRKFGFPDESGLPVEFYDRSESPDNLIYHWDFGVPDTTGDTSSLQNPTWVYTEPGNYDVTLTVTSENPLHGGDTATKSKYIKVFSPVALFTVDIDAGCAPLDVQFTNQSLGTYNIDSVTWYFGDAGQDSALTVISPESTVVLHTYDTAALFTCSLTVFSEYGNNTRVETGLISARGPGGTITASADTVCAAEDTVSFTFEVDCPVDTYSWDFGDGETSDEQNPSHAWASAGDYDIALTVSSAYGSKVLNQSLTVLGPATMLAISGPIENCAPFEAKFVTFDQCTIDSFVFDFGDGAVETLYSFDTVSHNYTVIGSYQVSVEVYGPGGSSADTLTDSIEVTGPTADFEVNVDTVCINQDVQFTETSGCNVTGWGWNFGDGVTSNDESPVHQYAAAGTYYISLTVTDDAGNSDTRTNADTVVVIDELPDPSFTYVVAESGGLVMISWESGNWGTGYIYWGDDDEDEVSGSASAASHTYKASGDYTITLMVQNVCGTDTKQADITVEL